MCVFLVVQEQLLALSCAVLGQWEWWLRQCQHGRAHGLLWAPSLRACCSLQHQHHSLSWALSAWEVQKCHPYTKQWCSILSITVLENLLWRGVNCSCVKFFILSLQAVRQSIWILLKSFSKQRRKLLFSLRYNQKWEILSDHIPSEKTEQIYLEQEYPIYWDREVQKECFSPESSWRTVKYTLEKIWWVQIQSHVVFIILRWWI